MNKKYMLDALKLLNNAYAPYSNCKVAAVLITKDGKVYRGVNVENASFGATNCAERTAIFTAITENGYLKIDKIFVATSLEHPIMPCGICRQVISEFADNDSSFYIANNKSDLENLQAYYLCDILPNSFNKYDMVEK